MKHSVYYERIFMLMTILHISLRFHFLNKWQTKKSLITEWIWQKIIEYSVGNTVILAIKKDFILLNWTVSRVN